MKILLLATAYNGMCQRVDLELQRNGHECFIELSSSSEVMEQVAQKLQPDLIVCPFLKHRVPESIWRAFPCLIVHPGIEGDRGPSSMDWAISQGWSYWGVTLLQADAAMDSGDIWGTAEFPLRPVSKASLYRREVISHAVDLVKAALEQWIDPDFKPRPLDYAQAEVRGTWQPLMHQAERQLDWERDDTQTILRKVRAADGFPGVLDVIEGATFYLYGARAGKAFAGSRPGDLIGHSNGAICRATRDGSVWIRQLKQVPVGDHRFIKLPALQALNQQAFNKQPSNYQDDEQSTLARRIENLVSLDDEEAKDIYTEIEGSIAYLTFDFYNGAMSTGQCRALLAELRSLKRRSDLRVIVLLGGEDFWSNGIHLNCIEAAESPARESWLNINAIDDVVQEIVTNDQQITVAALRNNAGAGGAMVPLACDRVVARSGVVLNPHYQTMGLFGSEYWTYLLPRRVGATRARELTERCLPLLTDQALGIGMVDVVFSESWVLYHRELRRYCQALAGETSNEAIDFDHGVLSFDQILSQKKSSRARDEAHRPLEAYRSDELTKMKEVFDDPQSDYHRLRYQFVYKISCGRTPLRLQRIPRSSLEEAITA